MLVRTHGSCWEQRASLPVGAARLVDANSVTKHSRPAKVCIETKDFILLERVYLSRKKEALLRQSKGA